MTRLTPEEVAKLWKRYQEQADRQAREQLIMHYAPLVKYVVGRLAISLPRSLENEDLLGYGLIGLIEAVDRYDPGRNVKFETFASARIRGQIIDTLRSLDLLPRTARRQAKEIEDTIGQLSQSLGRLPEDEEVAHKLELDLDAYHERLRETSWVMVSLDQPIHSENGEVFNLYDTLEDPSVPSLAEHLDNQEMKQQIVNAILALPKREQQVISLYYNDGLTMKEIGEVLGVSESRVSQMHAKAVLMLRAMIKSQEQRETTIIYDRRGLNATVYAASR